MKHLIRLAALGAAVAALSAAATPAFAQTPAAACPVRNADASLTSSLPIDLPPMIALNHLSGTALVEVMVGQDGKAQAARIVDSAGWRSLDDLATAAVLRQTYAPAIRDCAPVSAAYDVQVQF